MTLQHVAFSGFRAARRRLANAIGLREEEHAVTAAMEAVHWVGVLDACLRMEDPGYADLAGPGADVMLALRWAHARSIYALPVTGRAGKVRWIPADELPAGEPGMGARHGLAAYRDQLEGETVLTTLRWTADWFATAGGKAVTGYR